jgi:hypothetical protein
MRCEPADHAQRGKVHPALWLLEPGAGAQDVGVGKSKQPTSRGSGAVPSACLSLDSRPLPTSSSSSGTSVPCKSNK